MAVCSEKNKEADAWSRGTVCLHHEAWRMLDVSNCSIAVPSELKHSFQEVKGGPWHLRGNRRSCVWENSNLAEGLERWLTGEEHCMLFQSRGSIPSSTRLLPVVCNSNSRGFKFFLHLSTHCTHMRYTHTYVHTHIHTKHPYM